MPKAAEKKPTFVKVKVLQTFASPTRAHSIGAEVVMDEDEAAPLEAAGAIEVICEVEEVPPPVVPDPDADEAAQIAAAMGGNAPPPKAV